MVGVGVALEEGGGLPLEPGKAWSLLPHSTPFHSFQRKTTSDINRNTEPAFSGPVGGKLVWGEPSRAPPSVHLQKEGGDVWAEACFGEEGDSPDPSRVTQRLESQDNLVHLTRSIPL